MLRLPLRSLRHYTVRPMSTTAASVAWSNSSPRPANLWLHRFAVVVAVCTLCLILVGSMVTTTGSGLAVPDWPTTYGQNMFTYPPSDWVGGIFYEHVHRLIAASVGLLTIVLCVWLWLSAHRRSVKWLGTAALCAVCLQGLLGGLTVILLLPTWVSVAHAGLAQLFFCITVSVAVITSPRWVRGMSVGPRRVAGGEIGNPKSAPDTGGLRKFCIVMLVCVYLQIILGAVMRHTQSGLAIPDFPLSYGTLLPPTSGAALESINTDRVWEMDLEPVSLAQIWIHFAHRLGAVVVGLAVVLLTHRILTRFGRETALVGSVMGLVGLLIFQIVLGAVTVWTRSSLFVTTAHIGTGALMLATSMIVVLQSLRFEPSASARADLISGAPAQLSPSVPLAGEL